jgi:hypothetical protein
MGVYYFYVNDTKREFFCIDPTGIDIKFYALGRNIGSRALSFLLLEHNADYALYEPHPRVGSWIGDRVFITGDDYGPTFDRVQSEFAKIGQAIIEMIVDIAPYDLLTYGGADWLVSLMEHNGTLITISDEMRRRVLKEFRQENSPRRSEELDRVIAALRPGDPTR